MTDIKHQLVKEFDLMQQTYKQVRDAAAKGLAQKEQAQSVDPALQVYHDRLSFLKDQGYAEDEALAQLKGDLYMSEQTWRGLVKPKS